MNKAVRQFKALSDPGRLRILAMLAVKPMCVCEITAVLGLAVSTVSKHLSILREAGFITDAKDQKWVEYSLNQESDHSVRALLDLQRRMTGNDPVIEADRIKAGTADRRELCRSQNGDGRPETGQNKE
ncbi:winged helix-turn-helix transcriptional regulator [bacterium]|nr:winged helix-turn-helix transcriptional regulator [bacterium]